MKTLNKSNVIMHTFSIIKHHATKGKNPNVHTLKSNTKY